MKMNGMGWRWLRRATLGSVAAIIAVTTVMAQGFRDPKTGQIWTQDNVSKESRPLNAPSGPPTSADRAFDPNAQIAAIPGVVVQRPVATLVSSVPITAGPTVPIASLESGNLVAIPSDHWRTTMYVANNSAGVAYPEINCRFMNADRVVQDTHIVVPAVGPGQRVSVQIQGPRTDLFVDRVPCRLLTPQ
jgi:hypothetical protein